MAASIHGRLEFLFSFNANWTFQKPFLSYTFLHAHFKNDDAHTMSLFCLFWSRFYLIRLFCNCNAHLWYTVCAHCTVHTQTHMHRLPFLFFGFCRCFEIVSRKCYFHITHFVRSVKILRCFYFCIKFIPGSMVSLCTKRKKLASWIALVLVLTVASKWAQILRQNVNKNRQWQWKNK